MLNERHRQIVEEVDTGASMASVARRLGISRGRVREIVVRGRRQLAMDRKRNEATADGITDDLPLRMLPISDAARNRLLRGLGGDLPVGVLRRMADEDLLRVWEVGKSTVRELRRTIGHQPGPKLRA
jgi:hypothetical protein